MPGRTLQIPTAEVFAPLLDPARYKGAWGGRGSGKTHFFGSLLIEDGLRSPGDRGEGLRAVCMREVQRDLSQSSKALIERKLAELRLGEADGFRVYQDCISAPKDGLILFKGMNGFTSESIKSLEGIHRAWFDEAQMASPTSLQLLRPTIRATGSELWFSWNPRRKGDPIDALLRGSETPTGSVVVQANWGDNPWFPAELEQERLDCLRLQPDQYDHIWNGGYATVSAGAYYAAQIADMKREGRLGRVQADPLMTTRAIWDIGGTGARADACAIWIAQFVGREIRVLDYYEAQGQPLATHIEWLRRSGYGNALCVLPHDGATNDKVYAVSYESALREAGFEVIVVPNQGRGAAMFRIEAARRLFPSIWINEATTSAGLDALGAYHAKIDEARQIDLGPDHSWASHASDAFGLMCVTYEQPQVEREAAPKRARSGWMG